MALIDGDCPQLHDSLAASSSDRPPNSEYCDSALRDFVDSGEEVLLDPIMLECFAHIIGSIYLHSLFHELEASLSYEFTS